MFCAYTRSRYQVSIYRTIGPLVVLSYNSNSYYTFQPKSYWEEEVYCIRRNASDALYHLQHVSCVHNRQDKDNKRNSSNSVPGVFMWMV